MKIPVLSFALIVFHPIRTSMALTAALALICCTAAAAQTTTISGKVFDPRTTSDALPLPNVLVYATTGPVAPLPTGVQCLTYNAPQGAATYAYTAVDGSFTLDKVPENATYTIVIQSGKWRRQYTQAVATSAVTGLQLHMPANHTQGDIPLIAVATGQVDGVECVLHNMGIDSSEFTDDTGSTNPGGRIHLYRGSGRSGAFISLNTPFQDVLTGDAKVLSQYDMVMFPCQGSPFAQSPAALQNIVDYADAGGRIFATHYSFVWLKPDSPYNSPFLPVADWNTAHPVAVNGVATVNTAFTEGATLAQWLQNAGATVNNSPDHIQVNTVRSDMGEVIPPTQSWLTYPDLSGGSAVLQMTFNTPVGAPAANQCGRVMFNEYHVVNESNANTAFPGECPASTAMTAQEEMLEYALFDLSAFVQPVIVPTLKMAFDPNPLRVKLGGSEYQVSLNTANTSGTTAIDKASVLKITLPSLLTATAIDGGTGWNCTLSTLNCTRFTLLNAGASETVKLTLNSSSLPPGSPAPSAQVIVATVSNPIFSSDVKASDPVNFQVTPDLSWATPAPIIYGTSLGSAQLNATSSLTGTFAYSPAAGILLNPGQHKLQVTFTPSDTENYSDTTASVLLTVLPATLQVKVTASGNPAFISNPVTLSASVPTPNAPASGNITFLDGTAQLGTATISSGSASLITSALAIGTHSITAVYSGDSNYSAATSASILQTMEDFTLSVADSGKATILPGKGADFSLSIAPLGAPGTAAVIQLTVDGLPPQSTFTFSPATVATNSGKTAVTLHVVPGGYAQNHPDAPFGPRSWPAALGVLLFPFAFRRWKLKRGARLMLIALAGAWIITAVSACGGIVYTPRSFPITVTAASGGLSHTTSVNLTVK